MGQFKKLMSKIWQTAGQTIVSVTTKFHGREHCGRIMYVPRPATTTDCYVTISSYKNLSFANVWLANLGYWSQTCVPILAASAAIWYCEQWSLLKLSSCCWWPDVDVVDVDVEFMGLACCSTLKLGEVLLIVAVAAPWWPIIIDGMDMVGCGGLASGDWWWWCCCCWFGSVWFVASDELWDNEVNDDWWRPWNWCRWCKLLRSRWACEYLFRVFAICSLRWFWLLLLFNW